jgi:lactoylglutathione lyase
VSADSADRQLFRKVDALQVPVPSLDEGLAFYGDRLGHEVIWRTGTAIGLRMPESDTEIVIQTERDEMEVDLYVQSTDEAARIFVAAGGRVVVPPFDIAIGRCVVVEDPFANRLVLLDMTRGPLESDGGQDG